MSTRVTYMDNGAGVEIKIASKKQVFVQLFLLIWLAGWTIGGISALRHALEDDPSGARMSLIFWIMGWLFGEVFAIYVFFWTTFGKETMRVASGMLSTKRTIFSMEVSKSFKTHEISNLRFASGMIVFEDAKKKSRQFSYSLEETEAQEIIQRLKAYLPESAFYDPDTCV